MQNKRKKNQLGRDGGAEPLGFTDRRKTPLSKEAMFRVMVFLNICAWIALLAALLFFHYARPELISGVQKFFGEEGRVYWSPEHVEGLLAALQICLGLSLISIILRSRRNRRKADSFGINLLILVVITAIGLATLYTSSIL
jgi:nitric oxide reductase large subunit